MSKKKGTGPNSAAPGSIGAAVQGAAKEKALAAALGEIERAYGPGSIMRLGDQANMMRDVSGISTGSVTLDLALGGKGLPRGRVVEIYGPESSGKTTLTLHAIASAQKTGGICAFVDAEHALDPTYARRLGVQLDDLLVSQPDTGEQGLEIVEALVRSNAVDMVVIDSVAALVPRAEIEGEMGDSFVGLHARLMSQGLRKLTGAIAKSNCLVIFINQIREKIGVMFGSPETTTGGRALKFYSSVRLDIRRIGQLKAGEEVVGNRTKVTVVKNKLAPPFRKVEFDILYSQGISKEGELLDLGQKAGIVLKSGTWFSLKHPTDGEIRLGQGMERSRSFLIDNPDLAAVIEEAIFSKWAPKPEEEASESTGKAKPKPDEKAEEPTEPSPKKAQPAASGKA
ncbi:MAG TPA: recombinase RecA [Planctomycetes bacterium]|nr:recombinase RecA [Planctomycetota bacterium]HIL38542.1 recombinase RecA [Planctomycetota bacterium]